MKKVILCVVLCFCMLATVAPAFAATYTDVEGHWAESAIERWAEEDIIHGYEDDSYKPENDLTRAEFVTMIVNMLEPAATADLAKYKDVDEDAWYYEAMSKAVALGIITGYENNTLAPNGKITRQEAITMLNRVLGLTASEDSKMSFTDAKKVASWADEAMKAFTEKGYINGYEDGSVQPTGLITRAEAAKILDRAIGMIITKPGEYNLSKVSGNIIVRAKDVTLLKVPEGANVCVVDKDTKATLSVKDANVVVVGEEETTPAPATEPTKTSGGSGGGSGSSTKTVCTITITTDGDVYTATKNKTLATNNYLQVVLDGQELFTSEEKVTSSTFNSVMEKVFNAVDVAKAVNTIAQDEYKDSETVIKWGTKTVNSLMGTNNEYNGADIQRVYRVLNAAGFSDSDIKTAAIEALNDGTLTYSEGLNGINKLPTVK